MSHSGGTISHLQIKVARDAPMQARDVLHAVADLGLDGDVNARAGSARQVLFMDEETLAAFELPNGRVRENITTRGIALQTLAAGARVRAGAAVFEITKPCDPCGFIDDIRPGLREAMEGKRGMLARVIQGGELRVGDAIEIIPA